jgi:hypothetical protein
MIKPASAKRWALPWTLEERRKILKRDANGRAIVNMNEMTQLEIERMRLIEK